MVTPVPAALVALVALAAAAALALAEVAAEVWMFLRHATMRLIWQPAILT
jgi:hypothetical protein